MKQLLLIGSCVTTCLLAQAQAPQLFRDFNPGTVGSSINFRGHHLMKVNGHIVFGAITDAHPTEEFLYSIDGTPGGTVKLPTGNGYFQRDEALLFNGLLYVSNGLKIYQTDGTVAGTSEVATVPASLDVPQDLMEYNGKIYFHGVNGTLGVFDPVAGSIAAISDSIEAISEIAGTPTGLYVNGKSPAFGQEIFKLNSTGDALELVADIVPGNGSSNPTSLRAAGNNLFFAARTATGTQPTCWLSDGTIAGTQVIDPVFEPFNDNSAEDIRREQFISYNGKAYFNTEDAAGDIRIYESDGTLSGTVPLGAGLPVSPAMWMLPSDNFIYFYFGGQEGWWQYDPAANTSADLLDTVFIPEAQSFNLFGFIGGNAIGDSLFHIGQRTDVEIEPFVFDGDLANPLMLMGDIEPGSDGSGYDRCNFVELNGAVYFPVQDSAHGMELWCVNCTPDNQPTDTTDTALFVGGEVSVPKYRIYPNPVQDELSLEFDYTGGSVLIINVHGEVVAHSPIGQRRVKISTAMLPTGAYLVRVVQHGNMHVQRIVKN